MKGYICKISGETIPVVYLSLKELCDTHGLYYRDAIKSKRRYKQQQAEIIEVDIVGRKRRGKLGSNN